MSPTRTLPNPTAMCECMLTFAALENMPAGDHLRAHRIGVENTPVLTCGCYWHHASAGWRLCISHRPA